MGRAGSLTSWAVILMLAGALSVVAYPAGSSVPAQARAAGKPVQVAEPSGPCADPVRSERLLCPDLEIGRPSEMYVDRRTIRGRTLLRATNDLMSRGAGPIELRGRRDRNRSMNVTQMIRRKSGGYAAYPIQIRLRFVNVGADYGGAYWKVRNPLRFELWRVKTPQRKKRLVRTGPKQFYCFRDYALTESGPLVPSEPVYPACNQNPKVRKVTLGTSVGWSDIYPSTYDEQWIDVTGLRGCFAYVLRLDPAGQIHELDEANNVSRRYVKLPWRKKHKPTCRPAR